MAAAPSPSPANQLFYGDNLQVLREHLADRSVDLIYLDPPFNSKRDYNLLFKTPKGHASEAQIEAFEDTWHWNAQAEREFDELLHQPNTEVAEMMRALRTFLGENDLMAYLTMMANRLLELHRVLKPSGSLYLHCDPTASHYLKIVLDGVFGKESLVNEIIWKRTSSKSDHAQGAKHLPRIHDTIFHHAKEIERQRFLPAFVEHDPEYVRSKYPHSDEDGRRYGLWDMSGPGGAAKGNPSYEVMGVTRFWRYSRQRMEEMISAGRVIQPSPGAVPREKRYFDDSKGIVVGDVWTDIPPINSQAQERLGYPTQKPLALLERILQASSNEGDVVLDPFCGCGTAVHAAQKLGRRWVGIDITHLAISLIEKRLKDAFGERCRFEVVGTPGDLEAARDLARRDKYQFQWWAVSLVEAQPFQGKKKGADTGIDGIKFFHDTDKTGARKLIVSVKGGEHLKADDVRALNHVREREKADFALLLSLVEPTAGMKKDAAAAGLYTDAVGRKFARVQLLTVGELLEGRARAEHPDARPDLNFKRARTEQSGQQRALFE